MVLKNKNKKNIIKTQNQSETKNLSKLRFVFLDKFKMKKHVSEISLIKRNMLTPELIILVTRIDINNYFFSLALEFSDSLSSLKLEI
jgi:hypothetical protein